MVVDTDSGNAVFELDKTNNRGVSASDPGFAAPRRPGRFRRQRAAAALPGSAILVNWTVTNQSSGDTAVSIWQDSVYIDTGTTLSSNAVLLGSFTHYGLLAGGGSLHPVATGDGADQPAGRLQPLRGRQRLGRRSMKATRNNTSVAAADARSRSSMPVISRPLSPICR